MEHALADQGRIDEAINAYRRAVRIDAAFATAYHSLGLALVRRSRPAEAIEAFRQAVRVSPTYAQAYYSLGLTLENQGQIPEAVKAYQEALRIDPQHPMHTTTWASPWPGKAGSKSPSTPFAPPSGLTLTPPPPTTT